MLKCTKLLIEYQTNPIGLDEKKPRFSWVIKSEKESTFQTAYRIIVDGMWDTGVVNSDQSIHIEYSGKPLLPKHTYNLKVKIWDNHNQESEWEYATFETSFLGENLWIAKWIEPELTEVVPVIKKEFSVKEGFSKARVYATSYGIYDIYINGVKISDSFLTPGFTSYKKRLQYQTYCIENFIKPGINTIEVFLAKGWCCGRYPFQRSNNIYEMSPALLVQLEIDDEIFGTDESWKCYESKLRFCELYDGETFDNSLENPKEIDFKIADLGYDNIIGQVNEPVRIIDTVKPVCFIENPKGETIIDFGQNLVGFVKFKTTGNKGDKVVISHGEVLDKDGNFYTRNLRTAKQKTDYTLGGGSEEYHSRMTFQGFRYIRIDKFPGEVSLSDFEAYVICSDMEITGSFTSSHKLLNKLYQNMMWSHKGNFIDIPTDCPQRDERVGWTGDAQVFCKTAAQNMNTALFYKKWLGDLAADQTEDGSCLIFVPSMAEDKTSSGWGDAATICPWEVYFAYGDKKLLEKQYPSMKKWVEYIKNQGDNPYLWNTGFQLGDWLAIDAPSGSYEGSTSKDFIATAYYAYSTKLVSKAAEELGYNEDKQYYDDLYNNILENFNLEFVTPNGRVCDNTQTAQAMVLAFNLVNSKARVAKTLNQLVTDNGDKLTTGFLGTPYLCDALLENGYTKKAFDLLLQEDYPSWLFSVKMGATTIWEHWDGIKPDGTFWSDNMNSYNHYAYGSIADFMYKKIGGIVPILPGYKKILIKPVLDERITNAETSIVTMYGKVSTKWKVENNKFNLKVEIPCNTTATIELPDGSRCESDSGIYEYSVVL